MILPMWVMMIFSFWISVLPENIQLRYRIINLVVGIGYAAMLLDNYKLI
jgi:hypothetical protein